MKTAATKQQVQECSQYAQASIGIPKRMKNVLMTQELYLFTILSNRLKTRPNRNSVMPITMKQIPVLTFTYSLVREAVFILFSATLKKKVEYSPITQPEPIQAAQNSQISFVNKRYLMLLNKSLRLSQSSGLSDSFEGGPMSFRQQSKKALLSAIQNRNIKQWNCWKQCKKITVKRLAKR